MVNNVVSITPEKQSEIDKTNPTSSQILAIISAILSTSGIKSKPFKKQTRVLLTTREIALEKKNIFSAKLHLIKKTAIKRENRQPRKTTTKPRKEDQNEPNYEIPL